LDAAAARQPAWHGLGTVVDTAQSSDQAIRLGGLDWSVEQRPLQAVHPDTGDTHPTDEWVANVRTDTNRVLGVVSPRYQPFQNRDAFRFADALVGEANAKYETAGALRGGRRVWMLLKLPETIAVSPNDPVQPYLLVYNTFDASSALRALLTCTRVVCANTVAMALNRGRGEGVTIRHRGDLDVHVDQARQTLGLVRQRLDQYQQDCTLLRDTPLDGDRLTGYFRGLLPPLNKDASNREKAHRARLLARWQANAVNDLNSLDGMQGTAWAAVNAVTEHANHGRAFRGSSDLARRESRLESVWFGSARDLADKAHRQAVQLAAALN